MTAILRDLFGPGTWGTGGNMVAWVICGVIGLGWLHAKEKARHLTRMKQADQHHAEAMEQADQHHAEAMEQAERHHEDMKRHVTDVAGPRGRTP